MAEGNQGDANGRRRMEGYSSEVRLKAEKLLDLLRNNDQ
jgi:hypothetical protein